MTDRADQTIAALRSTHDYLTAVVHGLASADLARPSGASAWDVSQVLSHLGSGAEISLAVLEGALNASGSPDADFNKSVWGRWDDKSPTERAEDFVAANEALVSRYEGLDAQTRKELTVDLGFLPVAADVATVAGIRLTEFAHHTWDVEVAFDHEAPLLSAATGLLLDQAGPFLNFLGKADALDSRPVRITVHITAPERTFGLEVGDSLKLTDVPDRPDAVLDAPAEWWLRLTTGRHTPAHTPRNVSLTSASLTLDDLRRVFPGF
ncbi:maleylpyruvate isomerase family mycothiol-dependent enzyme [Streptomyces shenzhenensis]|uniref:maleylpyruvate isomerase family mycothiol-dependent enzyme n=1 Tax=Streptomyces shenzhenensis TaxID=943815 RepID=UPI0015F0CF7E|nr:maleylpyruvate isomerase family mycothiol-dependent enzyme [Streptomyces shenzhenensis]